MEDTLLSIGLLLIVAKMAEGLAARVRQGGLAAFLLAGILLGPVLGLVEPSAELSLFFSVGVIFLFFLVGVDEMDIAGFAATFRGRFALAAVIAFLVPFGAGLAVIPYVLELPVANAIALAGLLSLSSLGVAAKVLSDLGHLKEPLGLEIFTTVIIVELVGLLIVGFMLRDPEAPGRFSPWEVGVLLAQVAGFAVVAWLLAAHVFAWLVIRLRRLIGAPQLAFGMMVGGLFLVVVGAEFMGLHGSLGALLFGTALAGLPHRIRTEVMPGMRSIGNGLFIPLFFAAAGLHLDLSFVSLPVSTIAAIVLLAVVAKLAGSVTGPLAARLSTPFAIASGLMAKGVVEIALLVLMLEVGTISQEMFSLLTILMIRYIFVVPPVIGAAVNRARATATPTLPASIPPSYARYALDSITVKDILDESRKFAPVDTPVSEFIDQWVVPDQQDYVIVQKEGELAGILSLLRLRFVPRSRWSSLKVGNLVRRRCPRVYPDTPLDDVLERMSEGLFSVVPVVEPQTGELLGAVATSDVMALMVEPDGSGSGH